MENILNWVMANPLIVIIAIVVLFLVFTYNNLNAQKKRVEKSFSTIDVYLEKRFDEIGALLEQLLTAYQFEEDTHTKVAGLRSGVLAAKSGSINDKVKASNSVSSFIATSGIRTEAYPELTAIKNMGMFVAEKTSQVEDDIAAARRQYNNNVTSYNTKITSFPTNLVAKLFGFGEKFELFKVSEGKQERPTLKSVRDSLNS